MPTGSFPGEHLDLESEVPETKFMSHLTSASVLMESCDYRSPKISIERNIFCPCMQHQSIKKRYTIYQYENLVIGEFACRIRVIDSQELHHSC